MRGGRTEFEELPEITAHLEKALALNPQFAPAYATLANFYSIHSDTRDKALAMAKKAMQLEPGNLNYTTSYGFVLLNMGKVQDAKLLAARIKSAARSPQEEHLADEFARAVASREGFPQGNNYEARLPASRDRQGESKSIEVEDAAVDPPAPPSKDAPASQPPTADPPRHVLLGPDYHLEGKVAAAECKAGEVKLTLSINSVLMKFHAADLKAVEVTPANKLASVDKPPCTGWKGLRAKITFQSLPAGDFDGELSKIYFF